MTVGSHEVRAIEIIGERDHSGAGYLARSFDSDGNAEVMRVSIDDDGVFHFVGGAEIAPTAQPRGAPTARVRSTLTVAEDRRVDRAAQHHAEVGGLVALVHDRFAGFQ